MPPMKTFMLWAVEHDEARTYDGDVSSAKNITERANEGTDCRQRQKVCQDEPDPAVSATNVCVDVRRNLKISTAH
jgi:hypothetical protein